MVVLAAAVAANSMEMDEVYEVENMTTPRRTVNESIFHLALN